MLSSPRRHLELDNSRTLRFSSAFSRASSFSSTLIIEEENETGHDGDDAADEIDDEEEGARRDNADEEAQTEGVDEHETEENAQDGDTSEEDEDEDECEHGRHDDTMDGGDVGRNEDTEEHEEESAEETAWEDGFVVHGKASVVEHAMDREPCCDSVAAVARFSPHFDRSAAS